MAYFNFQRGYIRFKVVYYGPGLCGKTTNLEYLHKASKGGVELTSLETEGDRTIFFDYMPLNLGKLGGIETLFKLYTVPGQVRYNRTRQMVLRDLDGVIFVADSQVAAMQDNIESLRNLEENLAKEEISIAEVPLILQYNKRDLDEIATIDEMERRLNPNGRPFFEASALNGDNVKETLQAMARHVYGEAATRYNLGNRAVPPPIPEQEIEEDQGEEADEFDVEGERNRMDSWEPLRAQRLESLAKQADMAARPVEKPDNCKVTRPPVPDCLDTGSLEVLEKKLLTHLNESREILQQLVMTQVEQENIDELKKETLDNIQQLRREMRIDTEEFRKELHKEFRSGIEELGVQANLNAVMLEELREGLDELKNSIAAFKDRMETQVRSLVNKRISEIPGELAPEKTSARSDLALELLRGLEELGSDDSADSSRKTAGPPKREKVARDNPLG